STPVSHSMANSTLLSRHCSSKAALERSMKSPSRNCWAETDEAKVASPVDPVSRGQCLGKKTDVGWSSHDDIEFDVAIHERTFCKASGADDDRDCRMEYRVISHGGTAGLLAAPLDALRH